MFIQGRPLSELELSESLRALKNRGPGAKVFYIDDDQTVKSGIIDSWVGWIACVKPTDGDGMLMLKPSWLLPDHVEAE